MKTYEVATIAIIALSAYWVVKSLIPVPEQCYVQINETPYVAKWMNCADAENYDKSSNTTLLTDINPEI